MMILVAINFFILLCLSGIHFYWAFDGQWGFAAALPTNENGKRMLNPRKMDSAIVAIGLMMFAIYMLIYSDFVKISLPGWIQDSGIWLIIGVFTLRAFGDFKYIGFFKRIRNTAFASRDTRYYSPLCLWLGLSNLFLMYHFTSH